jgi:hypothetical protein
MGTGGKFLNSAAMACAVRSRIDKWDLIKLQSFCKAKDTINKTKCQMLSQHLMKFSCGFFFFEFAYIVDYNDGFPYIFYRHGTKWLQLFWGFRP